MGSKISRVVPVASLAGPPVLSVTPCLGLGKAQDGGIEALPAVLASQAMLALGHVGGAGQGLEIVFAHLCWIREPRIVLAPVLVVYLDIGYVQYGAALLCNQGLDVLGDWRRSGAFSEALELHAVYGALVFVAHDVENAGQRAVAAAPVAAVA